jgi:hypothetical protein
MESVLVFYRFFLGSPKIVNMHPSRCSTSAYSSYVEITQCGCPPAVTTINGQF